MKKQTLITVMAIFAYFNSFAQSPFGSIAKSATFSDQTITSGQKTNFKLGEALVMAYEDITISKIDVIFAGEPNFVALVSNFRIIIDGTQEGVTFKDIQQRRSVNTKYAATNGTIKRISLLCDINMSLDSITMASFLQAAIIITYHSNNNNITVMDSTTLQKIYWKSQVPAEVIKITPKDMSIKIYPNPTSDFLYIDDLPKNSTVKIFDLTGKIFYSGNENIADIRNLQDGLYFVEIQTNSDKQVLRFIKKI